MYAKYSQNFSFACLCVRDFGNYRLVRRSADNEGERMRRIGRVGFLLALLAVALQPLLSDAQGAPIKAEDKRMPKITEAREGAFRCDTAPALLVGKSLADSPAFLPLQERLQSRFQATMAPARPDGQLPGSPFILIGLAQDHPALRQLLADHQAKL